MTEASGELAATGRPRAAVALALVAVAATAVMAMLPLANASAPPKGADGPLVGGKLYHGTVLDKGALHKKSYYFFVRRTARVTAIFTNTTADVQAGFQIFNVDYLNAAGTSVTFPPLESLAPRHTDTLRKRLHPGKYFLQLSQIIGRSTYTFRLDPASALTSKRPVGG